jgi:hypothetical protein
MASKSCACKFVHLPYQLNLWLPIGFLPWKLLNPSPTFSSLKMFISLDLMLWSNMTKSHGNLLACHHFVEMLGVRGIKQQSRAKSPSAIELCSLMLCFDLRIASSLILNLVTTFTCYPSLVWCLFRPPNLRHLKFLIGCMFGNGVTISILWCRDET